MTPSWLAIAVLIGLVQGFEQPAARLRAGMTLVYESGGSRNSWVVDSARTDSVMHCGRVWLRISGTVERRHDCLVDGAVQRWSERQERWIEQRPITPNTTRRYDRGASRNEFTTGGTRVDTITGEVIPVIETVVLTMDSAGVARRRLRERYSIGLTTATWGIFEVPDGAGGWRTEREFRLVEIR